MRSNGGWDLEAWLLVGVASAGEPSACYDARVRIEKFRGIKGVEGNTLVSGVIMPERSSNRQGCGKRALTGIGGRCRPPFLPRARLLRP
jgi:hypothetical protein